jgi:hypothetical protein
MGLTRPAVVDRVLVAGSHAMALAHSGQLFGALPGHRGSRQAPTRASAASSR